MKSGLLPVAQYAVGRSQVLRGLCCDQAGDYVGAMPMIEFRGEHYRGAYLRRVGTGTRQRQRRRASTPFALLMLKPFEGCDCSFPKIVVGPGIRPLDGAVAPEVRKLVVCPVQYLPGLVWRKRPHDFDKRFFCGTKNHAVLIVRSRAAYRYEFPARRMLVTHSVWLL